MTTLGRRSTWKYEDINYEAFLVTPNGLRVAKMSQARARGIAAALNTPEGREAFEKARVEYTRGNS